MPELDLNKTSTIYVVFKFHGCLKNKKRLSVKTLFCTKKLKLNHFTQSFLLKKKTKTYTTVSISKLL